MFLAAIPVPDRAVLDLALRLRETGCDGTADKLEKAWSREVKVLALEVDERVEILRALVECPPELVELRSTLLQEHEWRRVEGL
jgi:hypothetical protein